MGFPEVLVPLVAIPFSMAMPVLIIYFLVRYARHRRELLSKERLAAIEKGIDVPMLEAPARGRTSPLYSALVVLAVGVGITVFFVTLIGPHGPWGIGLMIALVGVAMIAHWLIEGRVHWEKDRALDEDLKRAYIDRLRAGLNKTDTPSAN